MKSQLCQFAVQISKLVYCLTLGSTWALPLMIAFSDLQSYDVYWPQPYITLVGHLPNESDGYCSLFDIATRSCQKGATISVDARIILH